MANLRWHCTTLVYVISGSDLLLMERRKEPNKGLYSPPGGKIEPGESPLDAALRELFEETGLEGRNARLAAVVSELDPVRREAWLMFAVRVDAKTRELRDSREGACQWVPLASVGGLPTPPADPSILTEVLSEQEGVAFITVRLSNGVLEQIRTCRADGRD